MAERSFKSEVKHLRLGEGDTFTGEGILAITKALLEKGLVIKKESHDFNVLYLDEANPIGIIGT